MSDHRLSSVTNRFPWRHPGGLDRRARVMVAAGAAVALLGTAALIGSGGTDRSSVGTVSRDRTTPSGASDGGGVNSVESKSATRPASTGAPGAPGSGGAPAPELTAQEDAALTSPDRAIGVAFDAKIIRTGTLELQVARGRFEAATTRLATIAANAGGFVSASETSALDDAPRGSLTLRVPAAKFDAVVGEVGKVGDVQALNTSSQDVSGEYTDVASRLKALQAEREQITLVLGRAETIPDILSVRDRLAVVQGEIEQLQGRQKVLDDQTSLSTLAVSLHEKGSPAAARTSPVERSGFSKLWHDATDRFTDGGRSIALGLATMAPWLLLALALFLPARVLWRRSAPAEVHQPAPPAGPPSPASVG